MRRSVDGPRPYSLSVSPSSASSLCSFFFFFFFFFFFLFFFFFFFSSILFIFFTFISFSSASSPSPSPFPPSHSPSFPSSRFLSSSSSSYPAASPSSSYPAASPSSSYPAASPFLNSLPPLCSLLLPVCVLAAGAVSSCPPLFLFSGVKMSLMAFCPVNTEELFTPSWNWPQLEGHESLMSDILFSSRWRPSCRLSLVDSLAFVGVYLLPVLFVVFTARARAAMGPMQGGPVSIETALHADLALSLALDFLDVSIVYTEALDKDMLMRAMDPVPSSRWASFLLLILCLVCVVSLGFAFPVNHSEAETTSGQADIFLAAKFEFLVGLLLLDVPFLAMRMYWMLQSRRIFWFFLKNIFSICIRPLKLNQFRLAERERAKGTQRSIYEAPSLRHQLLQQQQQDAAASAPASKQQQQQQQQSAAASAAAAVGRGVLGNIQRLRQRGSLLRQRRQASRELKASEPVSPHSSKDLEGSFNLASSVGSNCFARSSSDISSEDEAGNAQLRRGLAAAAVAGGAAAAAAGGPKRLSRRQRWLLKDLRYSRRMPTPGIGCGNVLQRLLLLVGSSRRGLSGVLDGEVFLSRRQQLRFAVGGVLLLLLQILVVLFGFCSFLLLPEQQADAPFPEFFPVRYAIAWMVSLYLLARPVWCLLRSLKALLLSLCLKRFNTWQSDQRVRAEHPQRAEGGECGSGSSPAPCFVSLSNVVVFSLCRQQAAPFGLQSLLIGRDMIKGFRLCDGLLEALSLDLTLGFLLRVWAASLQPSWFNYSVFAAHLLLSLLHLLVSQAARMLALRRCELELTLEDLVRHRTDALSVFEEADSSGDEQQQQRRQQQRGKRQTAASFITVGDEAEFFKRDGYISSAGAVFPRVI
ncbi:hypothetical protein Efla_005795 [Eimeria flavescens]